jgi:hypothetical protein
MNQPAAHTDIPDIAAMLHTAAAVFIGIDQFMKIGHKNTPFPRAPVGGKGMFCYTIPQSRSNSKACFLRHFASLAVMLEYPN